MKAQRIVALAFGAFLGLALAGPATAAGPKAGQIPKSPSVETPQTKAQATAFALKITKVSFSGRGLNWVAQPGLDYAPVTQPGEYRVTVKVKNPSANSSPKGAKKCEIHVQGGQQTGYVYSYNHIFTVDVAKLNPGADGTACEQKVMVTDIGHYFISVYLKP